MFPNPQILGGALMARTQSTLLAGLALAALGASHASAFDLYTWDGGSGNWEDANWNGGQAGPGYTLNGNTAPVPNVLIDSGAVTLTGTLTISDDNVEPAKVTIDGGASLSGANILINWNGASLEVLNGTVTVPYINMNGSGGDAGDVVFHTGTINLTDGNGIRSNASFLDNTPGFNFTGTAGAGTLVYTLSADTTKHLAYKVSQDAFSIDGIKVVVTSSYDGTQGSLDAINAELVTLAVNGRYFQITGSLAAGGTQTLALLASSRGAEASTWKATESDDWEIGGYPAAFQNWSSTDGFFFNGDSVTFDDSVDGAFSGTVSIGSAIPAPASITFDNDTTGYVLAGELGGTGPMTLQGSGTVTLQAPDGDMPYSGAVAIQSGTLELAGFNAALRRAPVTIQPGGTFRYAPGNSGNSSYTPLTLAGGTLETTNNYLYIWPAAAQITLAPGTDSVFSVSNTLRTNAATVTGGGNLIKRGPGVFMIWELDATYTGSTTIEEGLVNIRDIRTVASETWHVSDGELRLNDDTAAPIENLPVTAGVSMTGGLFTATNNTETIGSLAMDSSSSPTILAVANNGAGTTTATLTVGTLDLTGTDNVVAFSTAPGIGTYEVMNATTVNGTLGSNLRVLGVPPSAQTWSFTGGVVSVTIGSYTGNTITYTNLSGNGMWTAGLDNDWTDGAPIGFYNGDSVTFGDSATGLPGTLAVDIASPVGPAAVLFTNTAGHDYEFAGSAIAGSTGLTKNGSGTVTLSQNNTFTGPTLINGGTLVLAAGGSDVLADASVVTVNPGATLELAAGNAIQRDTSAGGIAIDGGLLTQSDGNHAHYPDLHLSNGAGVNATSAGSFAQVNVDFDGDVTVSGTTPSSIGPMSFGIRFNVHAPVFDVADVTGSAAVDLSVDTRMRGALGFTKTGAGTMFIAANPNNNTDYNTTVVSAGCLIIEDLSAIPADLTKVSVGNGACFGGIVGPSKLSESDLLAIAANVVWDAGGNARLMIDTDGHTVDIAAELAGNFKIIATGGGTLNLNGGAGVNDILTEGGTTVNVASTGATTITVGNITTTAGTTPGTTLVTLAFTADGPVDVYASDDLATWGTPVLTGVSSSPVVIDNLAGGRKFFVLVSAGAAYPPAP